jgi:hypothetical protein
VNERKDALNPVLNAFVDVSPEKAKAVVRLDASRANKAINVAINDGTPLPQGFLVAQ